MAEAFGEQKQEAEGELQKERHPGNIYYPCLKNLAREDATTGGRSSGTAGMKKKATVEEKAKVEGLESLSVDEVCRLMTDMGLGYCVTALRTEKMDGQKLKDFKRAKLVQLLQDFGIRSTKGTLVWVKIQTLLHQHTVAAAPTTRTATSPAMQYIYSPSLGRKVLLPTPETRERHALRMLYKRCGGADWPGGQNKNWCDPDKPHSQWEGVKVEHGRVVELSVGPCYDAFEGAFPLELGWLTKLKTLSLPENQLGSAGAKALRPALEKLTSLTMLDLSCNNLGTTGAEALSPALEGLTKLTMLKLSNNNLGTYGAEALSPALAKLKKLTMLNLRYNDIGAVGELALHAALKKKRKKLTHLDLS